MSSDNGPAYVVIVIIVAIFVFLGALMVVGGNERAEFTRACIDSGGSAYVSDDLHICILPDGTVNAVRP